MQTSLGLKIMVGIVAAVVVAAAAYLARAVFAPLVLALFVIAVVWPLQRTLQLRMPKLLALAVTIVAMATAGYVFASLVIWAFGRLGRTLAADAARYQALYDSVMVWLEARDISLAALWAEHFNVGWLLRSGQQITGRINATLSFWLITFTYVVLGLLEVDDMSAKIQSMNNREASRAILAGARATAAKLRKYMWVRTQMSVVTGLLVGLFAWIAGLPSATEWGVIAFVLNYIPFIGSFIATLFPTLLAMTQFQTWEAVLLVFICLNIIQFLVGSYLEPRVAGSVLSISPSLVLFSIFFWAFLWGLFGAFIGVPITLAALTFCSQHPSSRWLSEILGSPTQGASAAKIR